MSSHKSEIGMNANLWFISLSTPEFPIWLIVADKEKAILPVACFGLIEATQMSLFSFSWTFFFAGFLAGWHFPSPAENFIEACHQNFRQILHLTPISTQIRA